MKSNQLLKSALILTAGLMLSTADSHAALYQVTITTDSLTSLPASSYGPFSLSLQFNAGGTLGNNTAVVSNFNFNGGSVIGTATSSGSVTGDISSTVAFNDTSYSELYQGFNPGTKIQFDLNITNFADSVTPDSFVVAILDSNLNNIPTTLPNNSFVQIDAGTTPTSNIGVGTGDYTGMTTSVPEPSAALLGLFGSLGILRRRRSA